MQNRHSEAASQSLVHCPGLTPQFFMLPAVIESTWQHPLPQNAETLNTFFKSEQGSLYKDAVEELVLSLCIWANKQWPSDADFNTRVHLSTTLTTFFNMHFNDHPAFKTGDDATLFFNTRSINLYKYGIPLLYQAYESFRHNTQTLEIRKSIFFELASSLAVCAEGCYTHIDQAMTQLSSHLGLRLMEYRRTIIIGLIEELLASERYHQLLTEQIESSPLLLDIREPGYFIHNVNVILHTLATVTGIHTVVERDIYPASRYNALIACKMEVLSVLPVHFTPANMLNFLIEGPLNPLGPIIEQALSLLTFANRIETEATIKYYLDAFGPDIFLQENESQVLNSLLTPQSVKALQNLAYLRDENGELYLDEENEYIVNENYETDANAFFYQIKAKHDLYATLRISLLMRLIASHYVNATFTHSASQDLKTTVSIATGLPLHLAYVIQNNTRLPFLSYCAELINQGPEILLPLKKHFNINALTPFQQIEFIFFYNHYFQLYAQAHPENPYAYFFEFLLDNDVLKNIPNNYFDQILSHYSSKQLKNILSQGLPQTLFEGFCSALNNEQLTILFSKLHSADLLSLLLNDSQQVDQDTGSKICVTVFRSLCEKQIGEFFCAVVIEILSADELSILVDPLHEIYSKVMSPALWLSLFTKMGTDHLFELLNNYEDADLCTFIQSADVFQSNDLWSIIFTLLSPEQCFSFLTRESGMDETYANQTCFQFLLIEGMEPRAWTILAEKLSSNAICALLAPREEQLEDGFDTLCQELPLPLFQCFFQTLSGTDLETILTRHLISEPDHLVAESLLTHQAPQLWALVLNKLTEPSLNTLLQEKTSTSKTFFENCLILLKNQGTWQVLLNAMTDTHYRQCFLPQDETAISHFVTLGEQIETILQMSKITRAASPTHAGFFTQPSFVNYGRELTLISTLLKQQTPFSEETRLHLHSRLLRAQYLDLPQSLAIFKEQTDLLVSVALRVMKTLYGMADNLLDEAPFDHRHTLE